MKTIEQLLKLSLNPFYEMSSEEREVLENFLSQRRDDETPQQKRFSKSSDNTPVVVRNIVVKTDTYLPEVE